MLSGDVANTQIASAVQSAKWREHGGVAKLVGEYRRIDKYYQL